MEALEKSLEKYLLELPLNFQKAIKEVLWKQTVNKIGLAHNLTPDQLVSLEAETLMVIYSIEEAADYINNLARELGVEEEKAEAISSDVTKEVFGVIESKAKEFESKTTLDTPVIITPETKKAVIEQLSQRVEAARQGGASVKPVALKPTTDNSQPTTKNAGVPEIAPEAHPMIKKGEVAHEVPHVETPPPQPSAAPTPNPIPNISTPKMTASPTEPSLQNPGAAVPPTPPLAPIPSVELKKPSNPINPRYSGGLDPYREPLV